MNSNLVRQRFTYKDLLLRKLSYAVVSSIFSQLVILSFYVFLTNIDVFHPLKWIFSSLGMLTSFSTLLFLIPFLTIIFGQSLICAKDYVIKSSYCSTRFQKFIATFSIHNLILSLLHITVGAALTWLFLSVPGGKYRSLIEDCNEKVYCLNEGAFFLVLSGFWTGFYFFVKIYIAEKNLSFPVIHQRKFLQLKSHLINLIKDSIIQSFWPSLYFVILYYIQGKSLTESFRAIFGLLEFEQKPSVFIYIDLWFFSALYYFNMNLMRFYFNLFLTEPVQFPLVRNQNENLTLQESITNYDWPIVQNLACLDLHLLAQWSNLRRQVFFTLSNPGGHPHNWNSLVENTLRLIKEYTDLLNKTIDVPEKKINTPIVQAPLIQSPDRFRNLRNMALYDQDYNFIEVSKPPLAKFSFSATVITKISEKFTNILEFVKLILGIKFLFGELPQANVRKCLANGHLIIWASQGIADIVSASLTEDKFGVVQKDLPAIITSLVSLKQSLEKLNKVPALTRKMVGYDDFNYQMKGAVTAAVKRSLFNICRTFEAYMQDIPLSKDIAQYLQVHIICKA
ncbi:nucleoporin NDC1-like [Rhynchophorus ferrugineus]|uniref:nucleoporin NDC1-like n=1 Tax=Rhynchophorus ferrugineus TaxID=354439 RepID=UPI003FCDC122